MSKLGIRWTIDGVPAACITRMAENGCYRVIFEREAASLEAIENIHWAKPAIAAATEHAGEGLPAGYGFDLKELTYRHSTRCFTAEVRTAAQYWGDVSGAQAEIAALTAALSAQNAAAETLQQDLQNAYEEGVESHG